MLRILADRIFDGLTDSPITKGSVGVDKGVIVDVKGDQAETETEEIVDLRSLTLLPGLIDTHVHISGSGTLTARESLATDGRRRLLLRAADNAIRLVKAGVTTVRDLGTRNSVIFPLRDALRDGLLSGPNLLVAGEVLTITGGHAADVFGREVDSEVEITKAVRDHVKRGADVIKVMTTGGILTQYKPNLIQFTQRELNRLVEEAHSLNVRVASHCHNKAGVVASLEAGVDSIEHGIFLDENGVVEFDPSLADRIVQSGTFLNPSNAFAVRATLTGRTDEAGDFGPGLITKLRADRVETWRQQHASGVKLVPGSDGGWYATPVDDYARMPQLMVSEIGMTPMDALRACTSVAAEAIGRGGEIGQLVPGSRADIIAVEGDPSRDIEALWRVRWVMIGGSVAWPDVTLNEPRDLSEWASD